MIPVHDAYKIASISPQRDYEINSRESRVWDKSTTGIKCSLCNSPQVKLSLYKKIS